MSVLLIEDDLDLAELVIEYLESESIVCDVAYDGYSNFSSKVVKI